MNNFLSPKRDSANNTQPFSWSSRNGSQFYCDRKDFGSKIFVSCSPEKKERLSQDIAEMIAMHALEIWPTLNGFSGYDCLNFEFSEKSLTATEI